MKRKGQIVDGFFFMIEFKGDFFYNFQLYLNNMGWIRIHMDPELLPLSGFGTWKFKAGSVSGINLSGSTTLVFFVNIKIMFSICF